MLILLLAVLTGGGAAAHVPLVFAGFVLFNLAMNAGPNATTFALAPELFPTGIRASASGFAAATAKVGATLGIFVLPQVKGVLGSGCGAHDDGGGQRARSRSSPRFWPVEVREILRVAASTTRLPQLILLDSSTVPLQPLRMSGINSRRFIRSTRRRGRATSAAFRCPAPPAAAAAGGLCD